jgi:hypothetical protein
MRFGKTQSVRVFLFISILVAASAALPAFAQEGPTGFIGLEFGRTSDKFGALSPVNGPLGAVEGQWVVIKGSGKTQTPSIVVGGEARFPTDTNRHASEFAAYGGPQFHFGDGFMLGFHLQIRKIYVPPGQLDGGPLNRDKLLMLELPVVLSYKFGPSRRAFVQAQGSAEFTPWYKATTSTPSPLPTPSFDYGYSGRAAVGYAFNSKWYAKAEYQTRLLKFNPGASNPLLLLNWRANQITGGVGLIF